MQAKHSFSSWVQLGLFTGFLFLLVAIPYTIYLEAGPQKAAVKIQNIPTSVEKTPIITPPPASTTTSCVMVPQKFTIDPTATPAAYLFQDTTKQICFPAALPPFPFQWSTSKDFVAGIQLDIPSNWIEKTITVGKNTIHSFSKNELTATESADLSFGIYTDDPFASDAAILKQPLKKNDNTGILYTKSKTFIAAVFPLTKGVLVIESSLEDAAFFAFEHMLNSLVIKK